MSKNKKYDLERFKSRLSWRYFAYSSITILLLLLLFKLLTLPPNNFYSNKENVVIIDDRILRPVFPDLPGRLNPIDTNEIITIPEDPLGKRIVGDLLNVYLHNSVKLEIFAQQILNEYSSDEVTITYFAEEYKRIQFKVPVSKRDYLKDEWSKKTNDVKFICYETVFQSFKKSYNDPGFSSTKYSWFYQKIDLFEAWKKTKGNNDIIIAVIDDSFDSKHPELKNQIVKPWNVFDYSSDLNTYNNTLLHGTHVAGIAVGEIDNGFGLSGVAPQCKLMPIQISDENGMMSTTAILDGIFYALKNGAKVINLSLGQDLSSLLNFIDYENHPELIENLYPEEAQLWNEVFEIANKEGVTIVQAAGNSNVLAQLDPMKRSKLSIIVGASDKNDSKAPFSNYGDNVDLYAPGVAIYSSIPDRKFDFMDGTSMASPIVAGCVALIKSINLNFTTEEIKKILNDTGSPLKGNNKRILNINEALKKINNYARS